MTPRPGVVWEGVRSWLCSCVWALVLVCCGLTWAGGAALGAEEHGIGVAAGAAASCTAKGRPDQDEDCVPDEEDACPGRVGPAQNAGCPDTDQDGDGLPDRLDQCAERAGPPENHGCPLILSGSAAIRLERPLRFASGRAELAGDAPLTLSALIEALLTDKTLKRARIEVSAPGTGRQRKALLKKRGAVLTAALIAGGVPKRLLQIHLSRAGQGDEISKIQLLRGKARAEPRRRHRGKG